MGEIEKEDSKELRKAMLAKQRKERGFDDSELYNLDVTFAKFMLPRIKAFREMVYGHPSQISLEEWHLILDQIIDGLEFIANLNHFLLPKDKKDKLNKSLDLLGKYFTDLWE